MKWLNKLLVAAEAAFVVFLLHRDLPARVGASERSNPEPAGRASRMAERADPPGDRICHRPPAIAPIPAGTKPVAPTDPRASNPEARLDVARHKSQQAPDFVGPPAPPWVRLGITRETYVWRHRTVQGCFLPMQRSRFEQIEQLLREAQEHLAHDRAEMMRRADEFAKRRRM